ncbi:MAG: phosphatidylglycerophosphatase A [Rhizobacter sp.]|nr:phosphatidylglycerophosphatase A [Rhizobacter sp.]
MAEPVLHRPLSGVGRRPNWRFVLSHPAHVIALGLGSGLAPMAAGTSGTLFAWVTYELLLARVGDTVMALVLVFGFAIGWWACTVSARHLDQTDPSSVVWDEVLAFWLVLWLVTPASWPAQTAAFVLFRIFDAAKPGPVAWADQRFKGRRSAPIGWAQGFGILFDDLVAALCTLVVIAVWRIL